MKNLLIAGLCVFAAAHASALTLDCGSARTGVKADIESATAAQVKLRSIEVEFLDEYGGVGWTSSLGTLVSHPSTSAPEFAKLFPMEFSKGKNFLSLGIGSGVELKKDAEFRGNYSSGKYEDDLDCTVGD